MKYICVSLILSLFLLACDSGKNREGMFSALPYDENIDEALDSVGFSIADFASPLAMLSFGDFLVIAQDRTDYLVSVFNLKTGKEQKILSKGLGNNELLTVFQLLEKDSTSFYVYDNMARKLLYLQLDERGDFEVCRDVKLDDYLSLAIDDSLYMGCCVETDNRYKFYNTCSEREDWIGDYTSFDMTPGAGKLLLQGYVVNNSCIGRMMWMSFYGIAWQVVSYNTSLSMVKTDIYELPYYHLDEIGGQVIFEKETNIGFTSLTCCDSYIYALYSGQSLEQVVAVKDKVTSGKYIMILDWDGNLKGAVNVDSEIRQIAYNKERKCLFLMIDECDGYKIKYWGSE